MSNRSCLIFLLLKPALFLRSGLTGSSLALDLDLLAFVRFQLIGDVTLFGRWRGLRDREFLDVSFGITGLGWGGLVAAQFTEVEVLNRVGYNE
jgi:hypothetical protein